MARKAKESVSLNIRMDKKIMEELEEYCEAMHTTKTGVVEVAVEEYLNRYKEFKKTVKE